MKLYSALVQVITLLIVWEYVHRNTLSSPPLNTHTYAHPSAQMLVLLLKEVESYTNMPEKKLKRMVQFKFSSFSPTRALVNRARSASKHVLTGAVTHGYWIL